MLIFLYSLSSLAISQLLFLALLYLLFFRKNIGALLPLLLCICLIGLVVRLTTLITGSEQLWVVMYFSQRLTQAVPAVIWILAYKLFADNHRAPVGAWILIASYQIVLAILPFISESGDKISTPINRTAFIIMFGIGLHVIIMALEGRADDLIYKRRRLRVPFAVGVGFICAMLFGSVFVGTILDSEVATYNLSRSTYIICIASIFVLTLTINLVMVSLFKGTPEFDKLINWDSKNIMPAVPASSRQRLNPRTVKKIIELMEVENIYRDPELTFTMLAKKISIKEHNLRKVINSGMGYRNFNQFLNNYRIGEACQLFINEENHEISISLVAFQVGYASLSSFNKAFKEITGVTPSAFRNNPDSSLLMPKITPKVTNSPILEP